MKLRNPNIELMDQDILYHLALGNESHDLVEMFGDVKVGTCFAIISYMSYRFRGLQLGQTSFMYYVMLAWSKISLFLEFLLSVAKLVPFGLKIHQPHFFFEIEKFGGSCHGEGLSLT